MKFLGSKTEAELKPACVSINVPANSKPCHNLISSKSNVLNLPEFLKDHPKKIHRIRQGS